MSLQTIIRENADIAVETTEQLAAVIWRSVVREHLDFPEHYRGWLHSKPAKHIGGDFHITTDNWVAVGDVSGKGIPAALLTGMFVSALKLALQNPDPVDALEHALYEELERADMFTTLAALELGSDGWINCFNLGHPPVLIRRREHPRIDVLSASAPPIGTMRLQAPSIQSLRLNPGDIICLYSDGLIEAEHINSNHTLFGLKRLKKLLSQSTDFDSCQRNILNALEPWQCTDDLTIILLEYAPNEGWQDELLSRR